MLYEKTQRDKILDLLAEHEKKTRELISLWLSGSISDEKMFELAKKLSTTYPQFDLTNKIPIVKYD